MRALGTLEQSHNEIHLVVGGIGHLVWTILLLELAGVDINNYRPIMTLPVTRSV